MKVLEQLYPQVLSRKPLERATQLQKLAELHRKYAKQSYITNEV
jgi:hypothetical protein